MATLYPVAGAKIYIGPAMDLPDEDMIASDFDGIPWTQIKGWTQCGALGDTAALITTQLIDRKRDVKQKGTRNAGQMQNVFAVIADDPGQIAAIAAENTNNNYPFRIVWDDAPAVGANPTPSEHLFMGLVMSSQEAGGGANTVKTLNVTLEINSNVVSVAPTSNAVAPANTVLPAITGTAQVGQTLTASTGTWSGTPAPTYAYQWFSDGVSIPGADESTYVPAVGDVGNVITVTVTASNGAGTAQATSAATAAVIAA